MSKIICFHLLSLHQLDIALFSFIFLRRVLFCSYYYIDVPSIKPRLFINVDVGDSTFSFLIKKNHSALNIHTFRITIISSGMFPFDKVF